MVMSNLILDEAHIRNLPPDERLEICSSILQNESDESKRWDAVWLAGEIAEELGDKHELFSRVSDLMSYVIQHDVNGVVKHEACFQIAARNMRKKIPDLINASLKNPSVLTKHEAIEALGLMRAFEAIPQIKKALSDPSPDVRETAEFVLKRLSRLENCGEYTPSKIL
jgi:hypothetical protein